MARTEARLVFSPSSAAWEKPKVETSTKRASGIKRYFFNLSLLFQFMPHEVPSCFLAYISTVKKASRRRSSFALSYPPINEAI